VSGFDLYQLTEEHRYLRDVVRKIADNEIAPHAAGCPNAKQVRTPRG
jgi:hypothetical protein